MKEFQIEDGKDPLQIVNLLEDRIYEFNSKKIMKYDGSLFAKTVNDEHGTLVAGIAGWTWAGICEITELWVDENVRKNGIGKKLLEAAEREAKSKGCFTILVRSFSFQAPHFYERYGYRIEHILSNFPDGYNYYFLKKQLVDLSHHYEPSE